MRHSKMFLMGAAVATMAQHKALDVQVVDEVRPPSAGLDDLPDSHPDWRINNAALGSVIAASPLDTRQQRRAAGKALARGLATTGKMKEREARLLAKKRKRADEAAARHKRIAEHVPNQPRQ